MITDPDGVETEELEAVSGYTYKVTKAGKYTVSAMASLGSKDSDVEEKEYTVKAAKLPAPVFSPAPGAYKLGTIITVTCTGAARIVYQVQGTSSPVAADGSTISFTLTEDNAGKLIRAVGQDASGVNGDIAEATYTIAKAAKPVFSPTGSSVGIGSSVSITSSTTGATITYTVTDPAGETNTYTGTSYTFTQAGSYNFTAKASAEGYLDSDNATASFTVTLPKCATPGIEFTAGTCSTDHTVTVSCATAGAKLTVYIIDENGSYEKEFENQDSPFTFTFPAAGTYTVMASATAEGYSGSDSKEDTYTVPGEVAPKITFSHEDLTVFGLDEEIDVTLSLNSDVYPVPASIYYTTTGHAAHNMLDADKTGHSPEGKIIEVPLNGQLSTVVHVNRSLAEVLNHRSVTINAYTYNKVGEDVAAATYLFKEATEPPFEAKTYTYTVTMANQGWTVSSTSNKNPYNSSTNPQYTATWKADEKDLEPLVTSAECSAGNSNYPAYYNDGLRMYSSNGNIITVNAPEGFFFVSVTPTYSTGTMSIKSGDATTYGNVSSDTKCTFDDQPSVINIKAGATHKVTKVVFVISNDKSAAKAPSKAAPLKVAGDTYELVTDPATLATGDIVIVGSNFKNTKNDFCAVMTTKQNTSNREAVKYGTAKSTNTSVTEANNYEVFEVVKDAAKGIALKATKSTTTGYLTSTAAKKLTTTATLGDNCYMTIAKATGSYAKEGDLNIKMGNNYLALNANNVTTMLFAPYASGTFAGNPTANGNYGSPVFFRKKSGGNPDPDPDPVDTPTFSVEENATLTGDQSVTISCGTEGATVHYTVNGGAEQTGTSVSLAAGSADIAYTVVAWATKTGMTDSEKATLKVTVKPAQQPAEDEAIEELFFVMVTNDWDADNNYPEVAVPFVYDSTDKVYELDIEDIPASGDRIGETEMLQHGNGFAGTFYVRDGKANHAGLVFSATGTSSQSLNGRARVPSPTASNTQYVEPGIYYNMEVVSDADAIRQFSTNNFLTGKDSKYKGYTGGTIEVRYTPGAGNDSLVKTLRLVTTEGNITGVDNVTADADSQAPAEYYNLQGVRMNAGQLVPGIYIVRQGNTVTKQVIR
ncbi:MAG: hypothetical protein ACI30N_03760 [Muribaculaceae bacterium]